MTPSQADYCDSTREGNHQLISNFQMFEISRISRLDLLDRSIRTFHGYRPVYFIDRARR